MFQALKNYLDSSDDKVVTKESIMATTNALFSSISNDILPTLKSVAKSKEYFSGDKVKLLTILGGNMELRTNNPEDVIKELIKFYKNISSENQNFVKLVDTQVSDRVMRAVMTTQEAAIMKTLTDLSSVALFTLDLIYYITLPNDTEYPRVKITTLQEGIPTYGTLVKVYIVNFDKHVATLYKVAKTEIKKGSSASMMDKLLAKHGKLVKFPILNGFVNNPIYHIRLWAADRDVEKYEALKDKKKLIELRLLDLKLQSGGKHDERLAKQISYYEDRVSSLEYDIRELEED